MINNKPDIDELTKIITSEDDNLTKEAIKLRKKYYGNTIFIRGLIEITNHCKNNCYYCGIRRGNTNLQRYRLTFDDILKCVDKGYANGFRTFVLQGGEDSFYTDDYICRIIYSVKEKYSECAVTLSLGEKSYGSYKKYFDCGADRYLLRHETADEEHYKMLHPKEMSLSYRKECLFNLKSIGYQVGSGFMVGSPYQTVLNIAKDIEFLLELQPQMIGIGPFISHRDTPFCNFKNGTTAMTLKLISLLRVLFPKALIPATTALSTLTPKGREQGILHGANVIMPNLSPGNVTKLYSLYDNKLSTGKESANGLSQLSQSLKSIGYEIKIDRGDPVK